MQVLMHRLLYMLTGMYVRYIPGSSRHSRLCATVTFRCTQQDLSEKSNGLLLTWPYLFNEIQLHSLLSNM